MDRRRNSQRGVERHHPDGILRRSANGRAAGTVLAALVFLAPQATQSVEITVGDVSIAIPTPEGFGRVTPTMLPLYELQRQFVAPSNQEFAAYIPEDGIDVALEGGIPDLSRRFSVQTPQNLINIPATRSDFSDAKATLKDENARVMDLIEERIPGIVEELNRNLFTDDGLDIAFSVAEFVPLPVHEESDRTIAFSTRVRYEVEIEDASLPASPAIGIITTTLVHVKGRVLFLYAYADAASLDRSRAASARWTEAILAANPPGLLERVRDMFGVRSLTRNLVVGAIVAIGVAVIARSRSGRRKAGPR
jgi:hypothetical protein